MNGAGFTQLENLSFADARNSGRFLHGDHACSRRAPRTPDFHVTVGLTDYQQTFGFDGYRCPLFHVAR